MKKLLIALVVGVIGLGACKKLVEDTKKNILLDMITDGEWYVEAYHEGDSNMTADFTGFLFQFKDDETVLAKHASETKEGTWTGDISTYSIQSNFPGAGAPLSKLNGTWTVKDSATDYVLAEMTSNGQKNTLKLRKKV